MYVTKWSSNKPHWLSSLPSAHCFMPSHILVDVRQAGCPRKHLNSLSRQFQLPAKLTWWNLSISWPYLLSETHRHMQMYFLKWHPVFVFCQCLQSCTRKQLNKLNKDTMKSGWFPCSYKMTDNSPHLTRICSSCSSPFCHSMLHCTRYSL